MTDDAKFRADAYDAKLQAHIRDSIIATMDVSRPGPCEEKRFNSYDIRVAVSMALHLYANPDAALIASMNNPESF